MAIPIIGPPNSGATQVSLPIGDPDGNANQRLRAVAADLTALGVVVAGLPTPTRGQVEAALVGELLNRILAELVNDPAAVGYNSLNTPNAVATAINAPIVTVGLSRLATICAPAAVPASNTLSVLIVDPTAVVGVFAPTTLGQVILRELEGDPTQARAGRLETPTDYDVVFSSSPNVATAGTRHLPRCRNGRRVPAGERRRRRDRFEDTGGDARQRAARRRHLGAAAVCTEPNRSEHDPGSDW